MRKSKQRLNINRRNFLTGTATLAGLAATASVVPIVCENELILIAQRVKIVKSDFM